MKTKASVIIVLITIFIFSGCDTRQYENPSGTGSTPGPDASGSLTGAAPSLSAAASSKSPSNTPAPSKALPNTPAPTATVPASAAIPSPSGEAVLPSGDDSTSGNKKAAEALLSAMTLKEKVGQMFFVRCQSVVAAEAIKNYALGGYILFAADFENKTKKEMKNIIKDYQELSDIPMLIGVDEEGGAVNRVSKFKAFRSAPFESPQDLYQSGGFDLIRSDTAEKAKLLKSLGINVNLAPVCDISVDPEDFIYNRSFGRNAKETSDYVRTVVTEMNRQGIGCTLKHFPGYGNNTDTHTDIAVDKRSYKSFLENDFLPFSAGIEAGAGSILVSHNIVNPMDKEHPASLSPKVHQILRNDLNFEGVIITDDLSMDAIRDYTDDKTAAVSAVLAGNDLLIATDYEVQIPAVIAAVKNHTITEEQINEAVMRILLWKLSLNIISRKA